MSDIPGWHIVGEWFDNCSCAVPCPCTFAQAPDNDFCESGILRFGMSARGLIRRRQARQSEFCAGRPLGGCDLMGAAGDRGRRHVYRRACRRDRQIGALQRRSSAGRAPAKLPLAGRSTRMLLCRRGGRAVAYTSAPRSPMRSRPISGIGALRSSARSNPGQRRSAAPPARPGSIRN